MRVGPQFNYSNSDKTLFQECFLFFDQGVMRMEALTITAAISATAAISGIILGWLGRSRTVKQDAATEATKDARLQADIEFIKLGVDDLRVEQRAQGKRFDDLTERVTRVEESAKQAHRRIDRLEVGER